MSELVANCPRCGAKHITFNLKAQTQVGFQYDWQRVYEAFCICKHCHQATIFVLAQGEPQFEGEMLKGLSNLHSSVNNYVRIETYISLKNAASSPPPEHLPPGIEKAFREGAACLSIGCFNAAATMFRLCLDLATKAMLPQEETEGLSARTRRDLGFRLPWLFEQRKLPEGLHNLSICIKQDGNDGAHDGSLTEHDAHDILDFTYLLLERLFTEPKRIEQARERQLARRQS